MFKETNVSRSVAACFRHSKNPEKIKLTNGGIVCDIKEINADIHIKCKNRMNMMFQIKMSEIILFQKLSEQEQVILKALKYLEN